MKQTGDEIDWVHIPRELHEQITDELEKLKAQKEIDRQEIERLKEALDKSTRFPTSQEIEQYSDIIDWSEIPSKEAYIMGREHAKDNVDELKNVLHRAVVLLFVYKPKGFENTMLENEYDAIKSEGNELLKGFRS